MLISQSAEYALRAAVILAGSPDRTIGTREISELTQVPPGYLAKVLQTLARAGIVRSTSGRHGGFQLTRPASELSVLEVVNAVDPIERIHSCPLELRSHATRLCPLHRRLDSAFAQVEEAFASSTISELLRDEQGIAPLCDS